MKKLLWIEDKFLQEFICLLLSGVFFSQIKRNLNNENLIISYKMNNIISNFESLSKEDISKYAGQWIAIIDNKVVAHNKSFNEMYIFVQQNYPKKKPLISKLPEAVPVVLSID